MSTTTVPPQATPRRRKTKYPKGGGFALAASAGHFDFLNNLISALNATGHDISLFFLAYTLAPTASYPTQLRQAVEALRYILQGTARAPGNVMIGGDSAGGNLALAVLLHLTHPHPEIDALPVPAPLRGVVAFAPWVSFGRDWPSLERNRYKDIIPREALERWARAYLGGREEGDSWSEPFRAPTEWWRGARTEQVLVLAGGDEILLSAVEEFVERFKVCFVRAGYGVTDADLQTVFPNTTYIMGYDETHVEPVYTSIVTGEESQQGRDLKRWVASRL